MRSEFEGILKALELDLVRHPEVGALRQKTIAQCVGPGNAGLLLLELQFDDKHLGHSPEFRAMCALCRACAYDELGSAGVDEVLRESANALAEFRSCGNCLNEGLVHWFVGIVHKILADDNALAISEFRTAIKLIEDCERACESAGQYFRCIAYQEQRGLLHWSMALTYQDQQLPQLRADETDQALRILRKCVQLCDEEEASRAQLDGDRLDSIRAKKAEILAKIREIELHASAAAEAQSASGATSGKADRSPAGQGLSLRARMRDTGRSWPVARIIFPVSYLVHGDSKPKFSSEGDHGSEMSVEVVAFDGMGHRIYNLREGTEIRINPLVQYYWLRVEGASMNKAHPIPILPDDFILMDPGQHPQAGQIVVADLKHPPTPDEQAGVVKRYSRQGLKSESSEDHKPIPLRDAKLRGVVIAVAKRFTEDE